MLKNVVSKFGHKSLNLRAASRFNSSEIAKFSSVAQAGAAACWSSNIGNNFDKQLAVKGFSTHQSAAYLSKRNVFDTRTSYKFAGGASSSRRIQESLFGGNSRAFGTSVV